MKRGIVVAIFIFSFLCSVQGQGWNAYPQAPPPPQQPESIFQSVADFLYHLLHPFAPPAAPTVPANPAPAVPANPAPTVPVTPAPRVPARPSPKVPVKAPAPPAYDKCFDASYSSIGYCVGELFQSFLRQDVSSLHKDCCKDVLQVDKDCPNTVFTFFNNPLFENFVKEHCRS
ncbi:hypothetical protein ACOSP7_003659 [Xanthoceras sorbifolium]